MGTVGQGYVSTYLASRRQLLERGAAMAAARIESDQRKYEAERIYYQKMLDGLDDQILEYDKLLARAVKERDRMMKPRTTRVTRGGQRESVLMGSVSTGSKNFMDIENKAAASAQNSVTTPAVFLALMAETTAKMRQESLNPPARQKLAADLEAQILNSPAFFKLPPGARAATVDDLRKQVTLAHPAYTGTPEEYLNDEDMKFLDPEAREKLYDELYAKAGGPKARAAADIGVQTVIDRGATMGGGSY